MNATSLSQYLKTRNLSLEPTTLSEDEKLTDEQLSLMSGISEEALITLILPRLRTIEKELVHNAIPEEVVVLRQAIVEIGGLVDDLRANKKEIERRREIKDAGDTQDTQPQASPPVKEGEEGSL